MRCMLLEGATRSRRASDDHVSPAQSTTLRAEAQHPQPTPSRQPSTRSTAWKKNSPQWTSLASDA
eukprot:2665320-Alexandrium_andersonii.AAC.1